MSEIKRSFCREHEHYIDHYICGHSGCADRDVRRLNTTIVEGPIERHKSRLASRETGDGLTGTYSGGRLERTESVPKWSRERRARAGLREVHGRDNSRELVKLCPLTLSGNVICVI